MRLTFPEVFAFRDISRASHTRQLAQRSHTVIGTAAAYSRGRLEGRLFQPADGSPETLLVRKRLKPPSNIARVLWCDNEEECDAIDAIHGTWLKHPLIAPPLAFRAADERAAVLDSWVDAFSYVAEVPEQGLMGLRSPQIGAVHAAHAHWSVSDGTATIVMPTGTGKTDAMISLLVSARCPRLLVIVPTDALRTQLADKFVTLGVLSAPGSRVLAPNARFPLVTSLHQVPRSVADIDAVFERSQVVVATSSIAAQCSPTLQERMAKHCSHLFIDEAHHAEAPTWKAFKGAFKDRRVLQFTATPFREDGKPLDGKIIFKYPLKRAQEEGYFKPIRFAPVTQYTPLKVDAAIAETAVAQLRKDYDKGHILMARVDSLDRAKAVFEVYRQYAEFNPVQLHTGVTSLSARRSAREKILSGESRIIVCVDMLGEGFDLPELKIAAFHDIRKSLAVTLQLAGRFTRTRPDLGEATFVANVADVNVQAELRKLYTRDPDWNALLPELSEKAIGDQITLQQFLGGFTAFPDEIPLRNVRPATSTVVYRTKADTWTPDQFRKGIPGISSCEQVHHAINESENTLVVVTARRVRLRWTDVDTLHDWVWELFVAIWSHEQGLLFLNGSSNSGEYLALARALCGQDVSLVRGQEVFRIFAGINRLRLQNVGLTEQLGRNIRFISRMGSDVESSMTDVQRRRGTKAVVAGSGFENGRKTSVGASRRGRLWSFRREPVHRLAAWCKDIGRKLADLTIDPDEVLRGTLRPETISTRPALMPIAIDWPEEVYEELEATWSITLGGAELTLSELSIELVSPAPDGDIRLAIVAENARVELTLELFEEDEFPNYRFLLDAGCSAEVHRGEAEPQNIADFFYSFPPVVAFADGSSLEGNEYVALRHDSAPYDAAKIEAWDWFGIDIRRESQGTMRNADTIQARVVRELLSQRHSVIFDDDGAGEIADVVAIRVGGEPTSPTHVELDLFHCKYSGAATPGRRIDDLYVVCGQAQKCISWMASPERQSDIFTHLLRRDAARRDTHGSTRFDRGDSEALQTVLEISRTLPLRLRVFIVQPGLSKAGATRSQLELLSVTENHLMETYQIPFGVIASP